MQRKIGFPIFASPVFSPPWYLWEDSESSGCVFLRADMCIPKCPFSTSHSVFGVSAIPVFSMQNPCPDLTCTFGPWLLQSALHWPAERGKHQCGAENIKTSHTANSPQCGESKEHFIKVQSRCDPLCLLLGHLLYDPPNPMMATLDACTVT